MTALKIIFVGLCTAPFVYLVIVLISKSIDDVLKK